MFEGQHKLYFTLLWILMLFLPSIPAMTQNGKITLVAGGGIGGDGGKATSAKLVEPFAVGSDSTGNLYIVEMEGGERLRKISKNGIITTIAGTGEKGFSGDGGLATQAQINGSHHLIVLPKGDILLADTFNNRIRRIDHKTRTITTIAGTGKQGFSGDGGLATQADFGGIYCLTLDSKKNRLYICDLDNRRIRLLDIKTGIVTTVAGNGERGVPKDGEFALKSPLVDPRAIALDLKGNLYILERSGDALRKVTPDGKIQTLIGAPNHLPAPEIGSMSGPKHLCVDYQGDVFIADTEKHRILKYSTKTGQVQQIIGTGNPPKEGDSPTTDLKGSANQINLYRPHGVFLHHNGSLYIADSSNGRILQISGNLSRDFIFNPFSCLSKTSVFQTR